MAAQSFIVLASKKITPAEFGSLMGAVGWGEASAYTADVVQRSLAAYPFIAQARDENGKLVGYVSAFSDGAFSTFIGELVVHPLMQRRGIGRRLLQAVEAYAAGVPVYARPFAEEEGFFLKQGYRRAKRPMSVLFKVDREAANDSVQSCGTCAE